VRKFLTHNKSPNIKWPFYLSTRIFKEKSKKIKISNKTFREADVKVKIIHTNDLLREKEQCYIMSY